MIVCTVYLYIATFGANVRSCRISRDHCVGWSGRRLRLSPLSCRRSQQVGRGPLSRGQAGSAAVQADGRCYHPARHDGEAGLCARCLTRRGDAGRYRLPARAALRGHPRRSVVRSWATWSPLGRLLGPRARFGVGWSGYTHRSLCPAVLGHRRREEPARVIREREEYADEGGEVLT
jgi:hypothetical protein